jgi:hypothetical protein
MKVALLTAVTLPFSPLMMAQGTGQTARAVRLSNVEGQVQLAQGDTVLASQALANTPLFEGTRITTADEGRAEIQFEDGSVARISPNSSLTLSVLRQDGNATDTSIVLDNGLGYFELQGQSSSGQMRVQFGNSVATVSGFTVLRVDLDNFPGEIAVFSGNAHLESGDMVSLDMHGGESVRLNGEDPANYVLSETIESNSWDAWNSDRDQALTSEEANRTAATNSQANSSNPAWNDLDANGNWYDVPGQGYVWSPYEGTNVGWDPYGCGNWVWTPGYGYIWVSCESWGYLPFQYGMWNYYGGFGWGWSPGWGGTWWNSGGGGWTANVGRTPFRYEPPHRPHGGPVKPGEGIPLHVSGGHFQPFPVVPVNRLREGIQGKPIRVRNAPAMIAGNPVQPLRPLSPRPRYEHLPPAGVSRPAFTYQGTGAYEGTRVVQRPGYAGNPGTSVSGRQGMGSAPRAYGTPARPPANFGGYNPRPSAPNFGSGGGASASRPSGGGYHPSFGGGSQPGFGGGGGSHPSAGGGGGGGAHPSGGPPHR